MHSFYGFGMNSAMLEFISNEKETNWFLQSVNVLCGALRVAACQVSCICGGRKVTSMPVIKYLMTMIG
jgi:hypothetical protein